MSEVAELGFYEKTESGEHSPAKQASAIMGALANPEVYALLSERDQRIAQSAARALLVAESDQRYDENRDYSIHGRPIAGNLPLTHRFLENALAHAVSAENVSADGIEFDRMLVNGMQMQNEALTFDRVANWSYNNDQDVLLNGNQLSDIEGQAMYDARLANAQPLIEGKLGNAACPSCGGLNTSHPDACGRDSATGELDGSKLELPKGFHNADLKAPLPADIEAYLTTAKSALEAERIDLKSPDAIYLVNYTEQAAHDAGAARPTRDYDTEVAETYRRAGMGEQLSAREMRGLGNNGYAISRKTDTPGVENDIGNRNRAAAIGLAVLAVDQVGYKTSISYERLEAMGIKRPAPGAEVAKALAVTAPAMGSYVKENATLLLAATEVQYSAKSTLAVFTEINNHGNDTAKMDKIEAAEPGMLKAFKFGAGDNELIGELENLARGKVDKLNAEEREHYNANISGRVGISNAQIEMIDKALMRPPVRTVQTGQNAVRDHGYAQQMAASQGQQFG